MPRTWFSWTDSVLLGSNRLFIVSELTVPGLKHAKHARLRPSASGWARASARQVILNRFEQRLFGAGLRKSDGAEQALGKDFIAAIPNNYALVREAIDRGVTARRGQARRQDHGGAQAADRATARQGGREGRDAEEALAVVGKVVAHGPATWTSACSGESLPRT